MGQATYLAEILRQLSFASIIFMACTSYISEIKGCFDYCERMDHEDPPQDSGDSITQIHLCRFIYCCNYVDAHRFITVLVELCGLNTSQDYSNINLLKNS